MRSGLAIIAAICRAVPSGVKLRSTESLATSRISNSSKSDPENILKRAAWRSAKVSLLPPVNLRARTMTDAFGRPTRGLPVVDMIEVSERTRLGCSIANVWAIIPPIDMPTTWARSILSASRRPTASLAISLNRYVDFANRREIENNADCNLVGGAASILLDKPMSRLSKVMTLNPRSTRPAMKELGQATSCPPRPITRSIGSPSPCTSYSRVMPVETVVDAMTTN